MPTSVKEICEKAKELPDTDKLALVDALLMQLDRPDPDLDTVWAEEARKRRQAYREGRLEARDYEQIIESLKHHGGGFLPSSRRHEGAIPVGSREGAARRFRLVRKPNPRTG